MTDFAQHRSTWRAAIDILVSREVANSSAKNPGAYAGSVRSRLLNDTRDHARALVEADPTLSAERLAQALDDTPDPPDAEAPAMTPPPLEPWTGPELDPDAGPYVDDPTEKLTAARRALTTAHKPPMGPKPVPTRGAVT